MFTVGVISVLIGTTCAIYPGNTVVSADSGASEATFLAQEALPAKKAT